jgi:hypothetical protein
MGINKAQFVLAEIISLMVFIYHKNLALSTPFSLFLHIFSRKIYKNSSVYAIWMTDTQREPTI